MLARKIYGFGCIKGMHVLAALVAYVVPTTTWRIRNKRSFSALENVCIHFAALRWQAKYSNLNSWRRFASIPASIHPYNVIVNFCQTTWKNNVKAFTYLRRNVIKLHSDSAHFQGLFLGHLPNGRYQEASETIILAKHQFPLHHKIFVLHVPTITQRCTHTGSLDTFRNI